MRFQEDAIASALEAQLHVSYDAVELVPPHMYESAHLLIGERMPCQADRSLVEPQDEQWEAMEVLGEHSNSCPRASVPQVGVLSPAAAI